VSRDEVERERGEVAAILGRWMAVAHKQARRRSGIAFREAADMQELWRWLHRARWGAA
jgi:hypothetical protein